jgi:hypothetical protein
MYEPTIPQEPTDSDKSPMNNIEHEKRKRIKYYLVDKPLKHQFSIPPEHESLMSVGN